MPTIHYTKHGVNKEWKKAVKKSPILTEEQKRKLVSEARKNAAKENAKEFVWVVLKIIGLMVASVLFYGLFYLLGWR